MDKFYQENYYTDRPLFKKLHHPVNHMNLATVV